MQCQQQRLFFPQSKFSTKNLICVVTASAQRIVLRRTKQVSATSNKLMRIIASYTINTYQPIYLLTWNTSPGGGGWFK